MSKKNIAFCSEVEMQSTLSSKFFENAISNIIYIRDHIGMFVIDESYSELSSFIAGMNYQSGGVMLDGFNEWLRQRLKKHSAFHWSGHILYVISEKQEYLNYNPNDLLFETLLKFLEEKKLHVSNTLKC